MLEFFLGFFIVLFGRKVSLGFLEFCRVVEIYIEIRFDFVCVVIEVVDGLGKFNLKGKKLN